MAGEKENLCIMLSDLIVYNEIKMSYLPHMVSKKNACHLESQLPRSAMGQSVFTLLGAKQAIHGFTPLSEVKFKQKKFITLG